MPWLWTIIMHDQQSFIVWTPWKPTMLWKMTADDNFNNFFHPEDILLWFRISDWMYLVLAVMQFLMETICAGGQTPSDSNTAHQIYFNRIHVVYRRFVFWKRQNQKHVEGILKYGDLASFCFNELNWIQQWNALTLFTNILGGNWK